MSLVENVYAESWFIPRMIVSNRRLLHVNESRCITWIVREHQLRLYWHVVCYLKLDPAQLVAFIVNTPEYKSSRERPQRHALADENYSKWDKNGDEGVLQPHQRHFRVFLSRYFFVSRDIRVVQDGFQEQVILFYIPNYMLMMHTISSKFILKFE